MPMRKHEMVYVFYKKLPLYDLSSHTHKFLKEVDKHKRRGETYDPTRKGEGPSIQGKYDPPLPTSILKEESYITNTLYSDKKGKPREVYRAEEGKYNPPLPTSVVKEELCNYDVNKNAYGGGKQGRIKISKDKKDHEAKYDPPLPTSVIRNDEGCKSMYLSLIHISEPTRPY